MVALVGLSLLSSGHLEVFCDFLPWLPSHSGLHFSLRNSFIYKRYGRSPNGWLTRAMDAQLNSAEAYPGSIRV